MANTHNNSKNKKNQKPRKKKRKRKRGVTRKCLGSNEAVEMIRKEVMVEILETDKMPSELPQVALLPDLFDDVLGVGNGGSGFALELDQEAQELLRRHLGGPVGVLGEGPLHVPRRLRLVAPELPRKAPTHPVAPHFPLFLCKSQFSEMEMEIEGSSASSFFFLSTLTDYNIFSY